MQAAQATGACPRPPSSVFLRRSRGPGLAVLVSWDQLRATKAEKQPE